MIHARCLLYRSQRRYAEAEPLLQRSVSILQAQLPADHPLTGRIVSNLAYLYALQGRYREAECFYLQALSIFSTKLRGNHPWMQEGSQNFRALLQKAIQEQRTDELSNDPMTQ
jgi:tetratricopeptide (TPR) repeat protein